MARAVSTDFLHSMRFHVTVDGRGGGAAAGDLLRPAGRPDAGFSACTTPTLAAEAVEYKEGSFVYARKQPGAPTVEDISLSRGVARRDTSFWLWMRAVAQGGPVYDGASDAEYRADLTIKHYHRDQALTGAATGINLAQPARLYHVYDAFPTRHKIAGDLDATAGEISIMEMDLAYERFEVTESTV